VRVPVNHQLSTIAVGAYQIRGYVLNRVWHISHLEQGTRRGEIQVCLPGAG
jgi:hypothetical protein